MSVKGKNEELLNNTIKDLKSSSELPQKPKKLINKESFVKLANEVKRIFEEEQRERDRKSFSF